MVVELGRIVYDIKIEHVKIGDTEKSVVNNRLAIQNGKDKTTFIDIVAWGKIAEFLEKYYKKGYELYAEGELINKKKKKDNVEFETVCLLIAKIKFTNGNHKDNNIDPNDVPDFLQQ